MHTMSLPDFLEYMRSVWGLLAGISTTLPFIGALLKVLPAPDETKVQSGLIATIACAFSVYFSFMLSPYLASMEFYVILFGGILFVVAMITGIRCINTKHSNILYFDKERWSVEFVITFWFITLAFSMLAAMDYLHQVIIR